MPSTYLHAPFSMPHASMEVWGSIPSVEDQAHCTRVVRATKCLTSRDKLVSDVAWSQLHRTTQIRQGTRVTTSEELESFVNSVQNPGESRSKDVQSLWSSVRKSLQHTAARLCVKDGLYYVHHQLAYRLKLGMFVK